MPKYKVHTQWTGYSSIIVEADNMDEAESKVYRGEYKPEDVLHRGWGLDYGYVPKHEETIGIKEVDDYYRDPDNVVNNPVWK